MHHELRVDCVNSLVRRKKSLYVFYKHGIAVLGRNNALKPRVMKEHEVPCECCKAKFFVTKEGMLASVHFKKCPEAQETAAKLLENSEGAAAAAAPK